MAQLLIRNLDKKTVDRLKKQAESNNRSLQAEAKAILENAAPDKKVAALRLKRLRESLGRTFDDSAALIREERNSR